MRNDEVNTLGGRGVVDAPQRLSQAQPIDAYSNMLQEVQSSWMRQAGGGSPQELTQTARGAMGTDKCGGYVPQNWDYNHVIPKCGGAPALPDMELFGLQNGEKPHFNHDQMKVWMKKQKESQNEFDYKDGDGFGDFNGKHKNLDKMNKGCYAEYPGTMPDHQDGSPLHGKPDLYAHPTARRNDAHPASGGASSVESLQGQPPRSESRFSQFMNSLFGRNNNETIEKQKLDGSKYGGKEGTVKSFATERNLTESERVIEQKLIEQKIREAKLRERFGL